MNLRLAILEVLQEADLRGASFAALTPYVKGRAVGEAWTREEIERELVKLMQEHLVAAQYDKVQETNRYFITSQGQIALAR